jgi:hypothetical protein
MHDVALTQVGSVLIVHRDDPGEEELRRRVRILLMGRLPRRGVVEAWAGDTEDEVRWRRIRSRASRR